MPLYILKQYKALPHLNIKKPVDCIQYMLYNCIRLLHLLVFRLREWLFNNERQLKQHEQG